MVEDSEILDALKRLAHAAWAREIPQGDPCAYLEAKAELEAAAVQANKIIAKVEGRN